MSGLITQGELDTALNKKVNDSDTNSKLARQQIGSLSSLRTNSKDTLVNSINELFQYASNGKTLVANAITGKGVTSNSNMTFQQLATNISNIKTGYTKEEIESNTGLIKLKVEKMIKMKSELPFITNDDLTQLSLIIKDDLICVSYITAYAAESKYNFYFDRDLNLIKQVERTNDNVDWGEPHDRPYIILRNTSASMGNGITINSKLLHYCSDRTVAITYFAQNDDTIIFSEYYVRSHSEDMSGGVFHYKGYGDVG